MKARFLDPSAVARAYRDPLSWVSLERFDRNESRFGIPISGEV